MAVLLLSVLCSLLLLTIAAALALVGRWHAAVSRRRLLAQYPKLDQEPKIIGFFHPYCNAGGGGERVLWTMIRALQQKYNGRVMCVVYTGDCDATGEEILALAKSRFGIQLTHPVHFQYLRRRNWVEDKNYPRLTMLLQSLGSIVLGMEAFAALVPDVYCDSMGYAFTLPLFRWFGGCKSVLAYVHYPTISTDMLEAVSSQNSAFNNSASISKSPLLTRLKLAYYHAFAWLYGLAGKSAHGVMVNSTWTYNHILHLWGLSETTAIVYPPCDVEALTKIPLQPRQRTILAIGQFRPEKNHMLQLQAFHTYLSLCPDDQEAKLVLLGGCRHREDFDRVQALKDWTKENNLDRRVEFVVNADYPTLLRHLTASLIGLHTMHNEHFGIGVVEYLASGLIGVAHRSAGPMMDIICDNYGYLASTAEEYAEHFRRIFSMSEQQQVQLQERARQSTKRFSAAAFEEDALKFFSAAIPE